MNKMSPSELADALEEALDSMTEETYDPDQIGAYLEALDRAAPMPEHPNSEEAYEGLKLQLNIMAGTALPVSKRASRRCHALRIGLAAALMAVLLVGGMLIAQAFGVNVFGAVARWTGGAFRFGELPGQETNVSAEYDELKEALDKRRLPFRAPAIPDGFKVMETDLYIRPDTDNVEFCVFYMREKETLKFELVQFDDHPLTVHEKDEGSPEKYYYNNICHYLFDNAGNHVAVWVIDNIEYSLTTNSDTVDLKQLIQSFYGV